MALVPRAVPSSIQRESRNPLPQQLPQSLRPIASSSSCATAHTPFARLRQSRCGSRSALLSTPRFGLHGSLRARALIPPRFCVRVLPGEYILTRRLDQFVEGRCCRFDLLGCCLVPSFGFGSCHHLEGLVIRRVLASESQRPRSRHVQRSKQHASRANAAGPLCSSCQRADTRRR